MHVVFSHGKESGPEGSKIQALMELARARGYEATSLDYRDLPNEPEQRVERLVAFLEGLSGPVGPVVLVGSSMGGYVSLVAAGRLAVHGLFLLAPALYLDGYAVQDYQPRTTNIAIVHGWDDDIIPYHNSLRFAAQHRASLHLIDGNHRLNTSLPQVCGLFAAFLEGENPSKAA